MACEEFLRITTRRTHKARIPINHKWSFSSSSYPSYTSYSAYTPAKEGLTPQKQARAIIVLSDSTVFGVSDLLADFKLVPFYSGP